MINIESISARNMCISIEKGERRGRPNKADVIRYHGTVIADHIPDIPFYIDDYGAKTRLCFPTKEARQAADYYGVRGYIQDAIREV